MFLDFLTTENFAFKKWGWAITNLVVNTERSAETDELFLLSFRIFMSCFWFGNPHSTKRTKSLFLQIMLLTLSSVLMFPLTPTKSKSFYICFYNCFVAKTTLSSHFKLLLFFNFSLHLKREMVIKVKKKRTIFHIFRILFWLLLLTAFPHLDRFWMLFSWTFNPQVLQCLMFSCSISI